MLKIQQKIILFYIFIRKFQYLSIKVFLEKIKLIGLLITFILY
jgi:hypothetical protein